MKILDKNESIYYSPEQKEKFKIRKEELKQMLESCDKMDDSNDLMFYYENYKSMNKLCEKIKEINKDNKSVVFLNSKLMCECDYENYDYTHHMMGESSNYKIKECKETIFVIKFFAMYFH